MNINGKVHCFFEQSGTFKNEFIKLGIPAEDYDIQNNFGQTDHCLDLFKHIDLAYAGKSSIFDSISHDDLILAFFPCIAFSCVSQMFFSLSCACYRNWDTKSTFDYMLCKIKSRSIMLDLLYKFVGVCIVRNLRMVFENPWGLNTFLKTTVFLKNPDLIDYNRSLRGDFRIKPTAYWFWNCEPSHSVSYESPHRQLKNHNQLKSSPVPGICSEERSSIDPSYARNFIFDNILGVSQTSVYQQPDLFENINNISI